MVPKIRITTLPRGKTKGRGLYPKRTSGFGMEGWEERKKVMVWA